MRWLRNNIIVTSQKQNKNLLFLNNNNQLSFFLQKILQIGKSILRVLQYYSNGIIQVVDDSLT